MFDESRKFNEYRNLVLEKLDEKLTSSDKGANWEFITPASLKAEALHALEERFDTNDEPLLRIFFKHKENATAYWNTIKNEDTTKFRPLVTYLRNRSVDTKKRNIELLAWLIDFQPRPFNATRDYASLKKKRIKADPPGNDNKTDLPPEAPPKRSPMDIGHRKLLVAAILLTMLLTAGSYVSFWAFHRKTGEGGCMVWTGEKYQQIACSYKPEDHGIPAIPLDLSVLRRFRKIMNADTLTANSIGKVFCVKIDGKYEYYTDSAANPIYPEKPLRRLTQFIMNNNP
jgi:hypothetical protein